MKNEKQFEQGVVYLNFFDFKHWLMHNLKLASLNTSLDHCHNALDVMIIDMSNKNNLIDNEDAERIIDYIKQNNMLNVSDLNDIISYLIINEDLNFAKYEFTFSKVN